MGWTLALLAVPVMYLLSVAPMCAMEVKLRPTYSGGGSPNRPAWLRAYQTLCDWMMEHTPLCDPLDQYQELWDNIYGLSHFPWTPSTPRPIKK
jgi:hypothetical protein